MTVVTSVLPLSSSIVLLMGGIHSLCETPECVCGLENVARTSINIVVGTKNM